MIEGRLRRPAPGRGAIGPAAILAVALLVAGCSGTLKPLPPTPAPTPEPTPTLAVKQTQVQLEAVLRLAGFGLIDDRQPFRPLETPALAVAPRAVFRIVLPADPDRGQLVVYDLGSPAAAAVAGQDFATFLAMGTTRVAFAGDERQVLEQVGSTLVFYSWSPSALTDPGAARAAAAVASLGQPIRVGP